MHWEATHHFVTFTLHCQEKVRDENYVTSFEDMLHGNWTNQFCVPSQIIRLSTGNLAPGSIARKLLPAKGKGIFAFREFCEERLHISATKDFFEPIKKQADTKMKRSLKI